MTAEASIKKTYDTSARPQTVLYFDNNVGTLGNLSGGHLGDTWEASGRHLEASRRHLEASGGIWEASGDIWRHLEAFKC